MPRSAMPIIVLLFIYSLYATFALYKMTAIFDSHVVVEPAQWQQLKASIEAHKDHSHDLNNQIAQRSTHLNASIYECVSKLEAAHMKLCESSEVA